MGLQANCAAPSYRCPVGDCSYFLDKPIYDQVLLPGNCVESATHYLCGDISVVLPAAQAALNGQCVSDCRCGRHYRSTACTVLHTLLSSPVTYSAASDGVGAVHQMQATWPLLPKLLCLGAAAPFYPVMASHELCRRDQEACHSDSGPAVAPLGDNPGGSADLPLPPAASQAAPVPSLSAAALAPTSVILPPPNNAPVIPPSCSLGATCRCCSGHLSPAS